MAKSIHEVAGGIEVVDSYFRTDPATRKMVPVETRKTISAELLDAIISIGGLTQALQLAIQLKEIIADGKEYEWVSAADMVERDHDELAAYEIWYQEYDDGDYRLACIREEGETVPTFARGFEMGTMKRVDLVSDAGDRFADIESTSEVLLVKI